MRWSDIPFDPPTRTLRQFAGLFLAFFVGLAASLSLGRGAVGLALAMAALGLLVGGAGLVRPRWIRPVFVGATVAAFPIGWAVSKIALAAIYFGLITPIGLVFRLFGRDALGLRPRAGGESYWIARSGPPDVRRYFRQF